MKKKLLALLVIGSTIMATSCKKLEEALEQNVTITPTSVTFDIDAISNINAVTAIKSFDLNFNLGDEIKKQASSFGINNLKSIKPKSFTFELTNSNADNNIGNFETLEVEVTATSLNPLVVVKVTENPATQRSSITIPANGDIELKQLMTGSNIKYNIRGKLRKATTIKLNAKLTANYDLVVGP